MINPKFLADRLFGLNPRMRFRKSGRRRPGNPLSKFAAEVSLLEERCLMSHGALVVDVKAGPRAKGKRAEANFPMPADYINPSIPVLFDGTATLPAPPTKLITIINNLDQTVYPIMQDSNNSINANTGQSLYDPEDLQNQTYRGYIGYTLTAGGQAYVGLPAHQKITIAVPLVFWDAARIEIATENPLQDSPTWTYRPGATQYTDPSSPGDADGVVMWYHNTSPEDVGTDAAAQLTEYTIRDAYLGNFPDVPLSEQHALINYDVSYVDSMILPVAMEAADVPVPDKPGTRAAYGWIGTSLKLKTADLTGMQDRISAFTSDEEANGLGLYFGGEGYPKFYNPNAGLTKVPAGQNVIADTALKNVTSTYDPTKYMLTSGGDIARLNTMNTGTIDQGASVITGLSPQVVSTLTTGMLSLDAVFGGKPLFASGTIILSVDRVNNAITVSNPAQQTIAQGTLSFTFVGSEFSKVTGSIPAAGNQLDDLDPKIVRQLTIGWLVTGPGIPAGTTITGIAADHKSVTLSGSVTAEPVSDGYALVGPTKDYATSKLTDLWYAWADHYVKRHQVAPVTVDGSINGTDSTLNVDTTNLVVGMQVTGSGIPAAPAGMPWAGASVLKILGPTSVMLSQLSTAAGGSGSYVFSAPQPVQRSAEVPAYGQLDLTFAPADQKIANLFAADVYNVMNAMSTVPVIPDQGSQSDQLMLNAMGCNVGFIPGIGNAPPGQAPTSTVIATELTNETKSIMRGVYDFIKVPQFDPVTGNLQWYPDPATATAGAKINGAAVDFNVYNMNPFVWFVHVKLGMSGYGFSVDDDTSDVGANDATELDMSIGGLDGLKNQKEWTQDAPFGKGAVRKR